MKQLQFSLAIVLVCVLIFVAHPISSEPNSEVSILQMSGQKTQIFVGQGFDKCEIPSLASLQTWIVSSPYRAVNLYGGPVRGCSNSGLNASFVSQAAQQGWKFIPTWVGRQSACWTGSTNYRISGDPAVAYTQGVTEAELAVNWALNLGLTFSDGSGTVIYNDLEAGPSYSPACLNSAKAYISGWVYQLQLRGNLAGVYGSSCASAISAYATISNVPDVVWPAGGGFWSTTYSPNATVWGISCLADTLWNNHQRIYQYTAGHYEEWGGVGLTIDSNVIDGVVATLSHDGNDYDGDGMPEIFAINRIGTGAGHRTEVHIMNGANQYTSYLLNGETALGDTGLDGRWAFVLGDYNGDGKPDLYAINKIGTAAGNKTEVHIMDGANQYTTYLLNGESALGDTGLDGRWVFATGDYNGDGKPDLYAINKIGTGAGHRTEVHIMDGASQYTTYLFNGETALGDTGLDARWMFAIADYNGDGKPDLFGVNRIGTAAGHKTEVHIMDGATQYTTYLLNHETALGDTGLDGRWLFTVADYNSDGIPDLYGINKIGTSSGHRTEAHIMDGATQYTSYLLNGETALGDTGLDCRWDFATGIGCVYADTTLSEKSYIPLLIK